MNLIVPHFVTAEDEEWNEEGGIEETKTSMDPGEDQMNEPGSEDEGKEKEIMDESGETNTEDNFAGMENFFSLMISQEDDRNIPKLTLCQYNTNEWRPTRTSVKLSMHVLDAIQNLLTSTLIGYQKIIKF